MEIAVGMKVIVRSNEDEPLFIGKIVGDARDQGLKSHKMVPIVEGDDGRTLICMGITIPYSEALLKDLNNFKDYMDQYNFMITIKGRGYILKPAKVICMHCQAVVKEGPEDDVIKGVCESCVEKYYQ